MRRAHAPLPASITSATSTAKESLGLPLQTAIGRGILALHEKHRKRLMILFNTAYGLAKKNRPFTDFPTVCSIQEKNGLVGLLGEIYITDKAAKHLTSSIAKTMMQKTAVDLHKARFVSVMSDGSTDTTIVEQEVVYVRYVDHGNPVTILPPAVPGYHQLLLGNQVDILGSPLGNHLPIKFGKPCLSSNMESDTEVNMCNFFA